MSRPRLTTTQRMLGYDHQVEGERQRAQLIDGTPCPRCGRGMYRGQELDLDHFPGRYWGGPQVRALSHRSCNRRAGQAITSMILRARNQAKRRKAS